MERLETASKNCERLAHQMMNSSHRVEEAAALPDELRRLGIDGGVDRCR